MHQIDNNCQSFPLGLKEMNPHCLRLFTERQIEELDGLPISIVGARHIKPWVKEWMENELIPCFRKYPLAVISGGARGVDQWAHWLALRSQRNTVLVLPSGLNCKYPSSLQSFQDQKNVFFISEYEADQPMRKHHFYRRNQLIALWSPVLLVVQAREKSGSMITARYAIEEGRRVVTIPANPLDTDFTGNNRLLHEGATIVRHRQDLEDIIEQEYHSQLKGCYTIV